jgi:glycosyltransferase involved in cell wall biosynthesis
MRSGLPNAERNRGSIVSRLMVSVSLDQVTVAIVARNAGATITRAVQSAVIAGARRILLVDDHSEDDTAGRANSVPGASLSIIRPECHRSVAHARQTALNALQTPYGIWLDADDELLPGRIHRMLDALTNGGAHLVFDPVILVDGHTGRDLRHLTLPGFLRRPGGIWRNFERNWIPMLAGGFDVSFARRMGYDPRLNNAEDYDFLLRSIAANARIILLPDFGYRYYHYRNSLSRDLEQARTRVQLVQQRFDKESLDEAMITAGLAGCERAFILAAREMILRRYDAVSEHCATMAGDQTVIHPYGRIADWCSRYLRATSWLSVGDVHRALREFERLDYEGTSPEVRNNLAVAYFLAGRKELARQLIVLLNNDFPHYVDAALNRHRIAQKTGDALAQAEPQSLAITPHFLRPTPSRQDYPLQIDADRHKSICKSPNS